MQKVKIIGAGLSGSEAALQLARRGIAVELWEQRPQQQTEAHVTGSFAELVCSNSFKSTDPIRAMGLLKEELRMMGSALLEIASRHEIPGGAAMVIDRERFSNEVTQRIEDEPLITVRRERLDNLDLLLEDSALSILATGPLTGSALWDALVKLVGDEGCYFYDATSPVLKAGSVDMSVAFAQSRYGKGGGDDYINCPMDKEQYLAFRDALMAAEVYPLSAGDDYKLFEGCLPIEEMAARGEDTMRYGPLKPKGLVNTHTGEEPYAAIQLRREDTLGEAFSLVGFQTRLRYGEQQRVFGMIPGLTGASFLRYGRMHRNSYLDAPKLLLPTLQLASQPQLIIGGQLTGLEGYVSAIATGLWAGVNAARMHSGSEPCVPPEGSCIGAMLDYMTSALHKEYRPTGFQFGMMAWLPQKMRRRQKQELIRRRAEEAWQVMRGQAGIAETVAGS